MKQIALFNTKLAPNNPQSLVPEILIAELEGYPLQEIEKALAQMVIEKTITDA
jgi:hypothetical protein